INGVYTGKNNAWMATNELGKVLLCSKVASFVRTRKVLPAVSSGMISKMKSIPSLRSIDSDSVVAGTRGIAETRRSKDHKNKQTGDGSFSSKHIFHCPGHR